MPDTDLTPWQRFVLAFWALFAVLFHVEVAREVARVREARRAGLLPAGPGAQPSVPTPEPSGTAAPSAIGPKQPSAPGVAPAGAQAPSAAKVAPVPAAATAEPSKPAPVVEPTKVAPAPLAAVPTPPAPDPRSALHVLAVLQREGRLVDFIEEDLTGFPDASIGAAARTVHAGCKRAIEELFRLEPVFREVEGAEVTVPTGFDPAAIRLTGNVVGKPPFKGSLRHHGWRAREVKLPSADLKDPNILAPAEVEL